MSDKVRYETTGGAGDVPGPMTERGDLPPGVSSGSGLGPGTMDGLEVSITTPEEEGKEERTEGDTAEDIGDRLTREENERYAAPKSAP